VIRPLVIGQAPSRGRSNREPLSGASGQRLARLCGLSLPDFLKTFDRDNVLRRYPGKAGKGDRFPAGTARRRAAKLAQTFERGQLVILLGGNVADAFEMGFLRSGTPCRWHVDPINCIFYALVPHPSGVNRQWNNPDRVATAERFFKLLTRHAQTHF
jgi:uracil-DNA glycosylase